MNASWYYASKGERTGPVTWEEIRKAVEDSRLGSDDYIWSPSFGNEWRKASTMTGLFPPPEPPPPPPPADDHAEAETPPPPKDTIRNELAAILQAEEPESPFTDKEKTASENRDAAPPSTRVNCLQALALAWTHTKRLIFERFSLRRWFFLSMCLMLTLISPPNPLTGVMSSDAESPSNRQADYLELNPVTESGVFNWNLPVDEAGRKTFEENLSGNWVTPLGAAMRETSVAIRTWLNNPEHQRHLLLAMIGLLLLHAIGIWFAARGHAMFLARIYRPDGLIFATWIQADKPAGALFRGMMTIRLISLAAFLYAAHRGVSVLAAWPLETAVTERQIFDIIGNLMMVLLADRMGMGYVRDFVAPRIVLGPPRFLPAFLIALQTTGFWFVRYLFFLFLAYIGLGVLLSMIGLILGMGIQIAAMLVFTLPLFGALLTLPIHLMRRLWTLEIVFQLTPGLRRAVPRMRPLGGQ